MTPIERAARALHELYTNEKQRAGAIDMPSWDEMSDDGRFYFTHRARAVLTAIREPSNAMLNADDGEDPRWDDVFVHNAWRAMVDKALAEGK